MMFKNHFGETVIVILAILMGLIMSVASVMINHQAFNYPNVFKIWAMITLVILLVSILIPYKEWSEKLTGLVVHNKESILYKLVVNVLPSLILNTCNTVLVSGANILYNEAIPAEEQLGKWMEGILHDWPVMFVVSYFAAFIAEAAGVWIAKQNENR